MASKARSHNRSGLRSPVFASSMILFAIAFFTSSPQSATPQSDADLFECDAQDAQRFVIELFAIQKGADWHRRPPSSSFDWGNPKRKCSWPYVRYATFTTTFLNKNEFKASRSLSRRHCAATSRYSSLSSGS